MRVLLDRETRWERNATNGYGIVVFAGAKWRHMPVRARAPRPLKKSELARIENIVRINTGYGCPPLNILQPV